MKNYYTHLNFSAIASISTFQHIMTRIYTDEYFRDLFFIDRKLVLSKFVLRENEKKVLLTLPEIPLRDFAYSLFSKRLAHIQNRYHELFTHFPKEMKRIFVQAYSLVKSDPDINAQDFSLKIGSIMAQLIKNSPLPPFCYDIAKYIYTRQMVINNSYANYPIISARTKLNNYVFLSPSIKIAFFNYDINNILKCITQSKLENITQENCCYLFEKKREDIIISQLSSNIVKVIEHCNGQKLSDIITRLKQTFSVKQLSYIKNKVIPNLIARKFIFLVEPPFFSKTLIAGTGHE